MKPHIPTMLLTALLAVQATYTAKADVIYSGHYYDNGKEMCSSLPKPDSGEEVRSHYDDYYCWANAASNMVQYWQDTPEHWELKNKQTTPPTGINVKDGVSPYGTSYLDVYTDFLDSTYNTEESDISQLQRAFLQWYFKGTPISGVTDPSKQEIAPGGYYSGAFEGQDKSYIEQGPSAQLENKAQVMTRNSFEGFIKTNIGKAGGIVGLDVNRVNPVPGQDKAHAITCVGYDTDSSGKITSIIVTDSDDRYFGTFKLQVKEENGYIALLTDNKVLKADEGNEVYFLGRDYLEAKNYVYNLTAIATPDETTAPTPALTEIDAQTGKVTENTRLTEDQSIAGSVTVGDGNTVVVLTTEPGAKLSIDGKDAGQPALDITRGALVTVDSLEVKNSTNGGVVATGNLHVGGSAAGEDSAKFTDNATEGNGGAINNESFVDISGNDTVVFSGNHADGKGGAIYSRGTDDNPQTYDNTTVSIRGNGSVVFTGNTAAQGGNDIYVEKGAYLNISDNESVVFRAAEGYEGEAAIVNKGEVYLEGRDYRDSINFENCSLDSMEGTVYIGYDINKSGGYAVRGGYGWAPVIFTDNDTHTLNIYAMEETGPVKLENVLINASGIYGDSANIEKSLISNMHTDVKSKAYTLQDLTLDTSNFLGEYDATNTITLRNVNISLGEADFIREDNTFNLSTMLQSLTLFDGATTFDASGLLEPEDLTKVITVQLGGDVAGALEELKLRIGNYEYQMAQVGEGGTSIVFSNAQPIVPEPATGTLSLLALAALAARRRRK